MQNASARLDALVAAIRAPDEEARAAARDLQRHLTKPGGALGRLEELHEWAAGVFRVAAPTLPRKTIVVAAADHGVAAQGVSAYPQAVTIQMARNLLAGGAAVNVLARQAGATVSVVDAGMIADIDDPALLVGKVRCGTSDMTAGPAMTESEALTLIDRGAALAQELVQDAPHVIGLGDMGIANTTSAAAITSVIAAAPVRVTVGRGTGIDDATLALKAEAIERALHVNQASLRSPLEVLAALGGFEIAFLAGVALGAATGGAAVVLDGYPTTAAALIATEIAPEALPYMLASHVSAEPGHAIALSHLGLRPLLDLDMRLGEGTGAALAMMLLDAALRVPREMATFESAAVSRSDVELRGEA